MVKSTQDERLIQFLMELNDMYAGVRSNILMMAPLPNVNLAYSLLIQDEKRRETYVSPTFPGESSSFLAAHHTFSGQRSQQTELGGRKLSLTCSHCKKPGHSIDKCYRIIGFPNDFKFTKGSRLQVGGK